VPVKDRGGVLLVPLLHVARALLAAVELSGEAWCSEGGEGLSDLGVAYVVIVDDEAEEEGLVPLAA